MSEDNHPPLDTIVQCVRCHTIVPPNTTYHGDSEHPVCVGCFERAYTKTSSSLRGGGGS